MIIPYCVPAFAYIVCVINTFYCSNYCTIVTGAALAAVLPNYLRNTSWILENFWKCLMNKIINWYKNMSFSHSSQTLDLLKLLLKMTMLLHSLKNTCDSLKNTCDQCLIGNIYHSILLNELLLLCFEIKNRRERTCILQHVFSYTSNEWQSNIINY